MDYLTFIIPSIGRNSLINTINSLNNQTSNNWKAIIIFDGCKNNLDPSIFNNNISFYEINKTNCVINQASDVRNYALQFVNDDCNWIAFLDDDDTIHYDYVEYFFNQKNLFNFDIFIYRMINKENKIFPSLQSKDLIPCDVGISFIVKKNIFNNIKFENSHSEDYDFLNKAKNYNYLILISNNIKYFVKSDLNDFEDFQLNYGDKFKIFLNNINPYLYLYFFKLIE